MNDQPRDPSELWYRASPKNMMIFAVLWRGETFLILMFVKLVIHGSAALYLLMIPWALFGLIMVAPELDYAHEPSVVENSRTSWRPVRKTTATRFSLRLCHNDQSTVADALGVVAAAS